MLVLTKQPQILRQTRRLAVRMDSPYSCFSVQRHYSLQLVIIEERLDFGVLIFSLYITPALPILWLSLHHYTRLYIPSDDFSALPTPRSFFFLHFAMSAKLSMGDAWEEDWESQADVSFTRLATSPHSPFSCDLCI